MGLLIHVAAGEEPVLAVLPLLTDILGTSWVVALPKVHGGASRGSCPHFCPPCVFQMSCGSLCPPRWSCLP